MKRTGANRLVPHLQSTRRISGFTHSYYRYPATTAPELVRDIILAYSAPGEVVLDPFMGGGTSMVEAIAHGRRAVGTDVNPLAVLIARAKTTPLAARDWKEIQQWALTPGLFTPNKDPASDARTLNMPVGLQRSFSTTVAHVSDLTTSTQRLVARCALLSVGRWALESRSRAPGARLLQKGLAERVQEMQSGMAELLESARAHGVGKSAVISNRMFLCSSVEDGVDTVRARYRDGIKLVVTSPPYPGVHVLYHRWQVNGRRETAAAYWIADKRDGSGPTYYTMGGRSERGQLLYFERLESVYVGLKPLLSRDSVIAQLVAFHDVESQLPMFLRAMRRAGFKPLARDSAGGLSRWVPNRKWYARGRAFDSSREFLLLHTPA